MDASPVITVAHGDGGEITLALIRKEILSRFDNPILHPLEDASWVRFSTSQIIVSTDSYIVNPPFFPGGDIGKLAVSGTVNDLIASGAFPQYITLSLVIAAGFPMVELKAILDSIETTAEYAEIEVIAGDTKVLDGVSPNTIIINTTGLGSPINPQNNYAVSNAEVGDEVIITGTVGDHSLAVLSAREGLGFEHRVQSDCNPLTQLLLPLLKKFGGIHVLRDPTRGGLIGVLVDISETTSFDIVIEEESIPLQHEVLFGCEMLGLDPCTLVNEGKMVIIAQPNQSDEIVAELQKHPLGKNSAIIGNVQVSRNNSGNLLFRKNNKLRVVNRPLGNTLPRLC